MVSFIDHYNAMFIDRLPPITKIGKGSWYFNNSLLYKPKVSSARRLFFIKNKETIQKASAAAVDTQHLKVEVAD